jgi:isoquinoline 1-oxidoreductase subunit beta
MAEPDPHPKLAPAKAPGTTRRRFLIGTGTAAGLVVGYALWPRNQRLNWPARADEARINGWVKIGTDGRVIVAVPQAEMGQGVFTSLSQILADELGADWNTVGVEPAPLNPIYANPGMGIDVAADLPAPLRGMTIWAVAELAGRYDLQMTGGSNSVRGFHDTIRQAGAAAREMLCRAAAREWGANWEDLDTANGFVIYKANRARFGDIAGKALQEDAPRSPRLRSPDKNRLMGKAVPRIDIPAKTDGSARFGIDVRLPGLVFAAILSGPVGDPALVKVDDAEVRKLPGVIDVVKGPSWVAVVANSWWVANNALASLTPVFAAQPKPAGPWIDAALKAGLDAPDAKAIEKEGDVSLLGGVGAITADYALPFLAHATMEPMNATARIDGGNVEVWAPVQSLSIATWAVAKALGVEDAAVTVHPTLLGGGFGRKIEVDAVVAAALIARATKRPVQLIFSREEDFAQDRYRPAAMARMRGRIGDDKRIAAWGSRIAVPDVNNNMMGRIMPALATKTPSANAGAVEGSHHLRYAFDAKLIEHALVDVPVPIGAWRSVGHSFTAFFVESFVDELAHAAGVDPFTFRMSLLHKSPRHAAVLAAAVRAGGPPGPVEPGVGRGIALHESFGTIVAQVAEVAVKDGQIAVRRVSCAIDCGRVVNPGIVRAQVESAIIFGLSAALTGAITFENGVAQQQMFDSFPLLGLADAPAIDVVIISSSTGMGGAGEPGTPPIAPAVANAIFAATGKRIRSLPLAGKV